MAPRLASLILARITRDQRGSLVRPGTSSAGLFAGPPNYRLIMSEVLKFPIEFGAGQTIARPRRLPLERKIEQ
jgi:hypothetical protein